MALPNKPGVQRTLDKLFENAYCIHFAALKIHDSPAHVAHTHIKGGNLSAPHFHDFYELYLVRKGGVLQYKPGIRECFLPRTIVFVPPSWVHGFACASGHSEGVLTNMAFSTARFCECMRFLGNPDIERVFEKGFALKDIPIMTWERMQRRIDALHPESGLNGRQKELHFKALMVDLAAETMGQEEIRKRDDLPAWLGNACRAMQSKENLCAGLSRFISLSGRTQEHLSRTLKKRLNTTPTEFINHFRLEAVAKALSSSNLGITSIAYDAGFNNLAHFNTLFRKEYGMTPREYRKQQGKEVVPYTRGS